MQEYGPQGIPLHELHPKKSPVEEQAERGLEAARAVHFDKQWEKPGTIEIAGEKFSTYDISPRDPRGETPVFIMDGWGSTPAVWKENIHALVETGRRAIGVNAPHGAESHVAPAEGVDEIPEAELRRITAFMSALDAHSVEKISVIGHSEGGIDALLAARMYPERFRNLVLVDPGGMIGPDSFLNLSARFAYDAAKSHVTALREGTLTKQLAIGNEVTASAVKAPILATKEVAAIARAQVVNLLREVKALGIGIVIINGVDDKVFPMSRMTKTIHEEKEEGEDIEKLLDGFYSVKGGHAEFLMKAPEYTRLAEKALTALELKQKRIAAEKVS
jgi:pimeloyl-ACP methyl ester carboxylesterase